MDQQRMIDQLLALRGVVEDAIVGVESGVCPELAAILREVAEVAEVAEAMGEVMAIKDFITETVTTLDLGHESPTVGDTKGLYKDLTAFAESRAPIMVDGEPYTLESCVARSPGEREPGPGVPYVLRHTPDGACVLELGEVGHALRGLGRFLRAVG